MNASSFFFKGIMVALKIYFLTFMAITSLFIVSCGQPSKITITSTPIPNYTPSAIIKEKLEETEQAFGRDIPIPIYLPEGYAITDAQLIQEQYVSYIQVKLNITAQGKPDISLEISWHG